MPFYQSLTVIQDLMITVSENSVILSWGEVSSATSYNVYRSDSPYFEVTGMTPIANTSETTFEDTDALSNSVYFYRVTWE